MSKWRTFLKLNMLLFIILITPHLCYAIEINVLLKKYSAAVIPEIEPLEKEIYKFYKNDAQGPDSVISALKNEDRSVRIGAAAVMGKIKDQKFVEPLIAALRDRDKIVRKCAASSLGKMKDNRAIEPLISALKNDSDQFRWEVVDALGNLKNDRAVIPLLNALKIEKTYVRLHIIRVLGSLGNPQAIKPLNDILVAKGNDPYAKWEAAKALGKIGPSAMEPLLSALKHGNIWVKRAAARGLAEIGNAQAEAVFTQALHEKKVEIIAGAYSYCMRKNSPEIDDLLIKALDQYGENEIAEAFLNNGNSKLRDAAKKWAEKKGAQIIYLPK